MNAPVAKQLNLLMDRVSPRLAPSSLQALQHWDVVKHVGTGSSADVWLLEHRTRRHQVACKTPHSGEQAAGLSQEAELAARLAHENLIRSINIDDDPELCALDGATFWEFLAGGSLTELVGATGHLSLAQTVTVLLPMIQATQYLQARQIVHGDISPRNIMFDLTGRPVLIDFGGVRATAHQHARTGTPGFVAPELVLPSALPNRLDARADNYALAAVAWFCLTGTVPGSAEHRVPLTTLLPELDLEIVELLEAGLSADPTQRPELEQFGASVAQWAMPEPVDLHASVGEDYGLVLPTRQPPDEAPRKHFFRRQAPSKARHGQRPRHRPFCKETRYRRSQRLSIALGTLVLAGGTAFTISYAPDPGHYSSEPALGVSNAPEQEDFQAVMDRLAKARSAVWAAADPSQVKEYALIDSPVFRDDVELLAVLAQAGHHLEGIRMRAVVEDTHHTPDVTVLDVQWQMDGYVQRDESGESIRQTQPREDLIEMEVVKTADGWRMVTVR